MVVIAVMLAINGKYSNCLLIITGIMHAYKNLNIYYKIV